MNRSTDGKIHSAVRLEKHVETEKEKHVHGERKGFTESNTPNPDCTCHIGDCLCQGGGK